MFKKLGFMVLSLFLFSSLAFASGVWETKLANDVIVDTSTFSGNLNSSDTSVQQALATLDSISISGFEILSNKSNDSNLGPSSTLYPTQNAVKIYADTKIAKSGDTMTGDLIAPNLISNYGISAATATVGSINITNSGFKINGDPGVNNQVPTSNGATIEWRTMGISTVSISATDPIIITSSNNITLNHDLSVDTITATSADFYKANVSELQISSNSTSNYIRNNGLGDLEFLKNGVYRQIADSMENLIIVRTADDLGLVQPDGKRHLRANKVYDFNFNTIYLLESLVLPNETNKVAIIFQNGILVGVGGQPIFISSDTTHNPFVLNNFILSQANIGYGSSQLANITNTVYNASFFLFNSTIIDGFDDLGLWNNNDIYMYFAQIRNYGYPFKTAISDPNMDIRFVSTKFYDSKKYTTDVISLENYKGKMLLSSNTFDYDSTLYVSTTAYNSMRINIFGNVFSSTNVFSTSSLNQTDNRIFAEANNGLTNSLVFVSSYALNLSSTTITTVTQQSYPLVGSWTTQYMERFMYVNSNSNGTWIYTGLDPITVKVQANINIDPTATNETSFAGYISLNGTSIESSHFRITIGGGNVGVLSPMTPISIKTGDIISINIERYTGTGNVVFTNGNIIINKI